MDAAHGLYIADSPAYIRDRHLQPKAVIGLQKDALGLHEPLPHSAIRGLPKIPAFRMLQMGLAGNQGDPDICQRRTGEDPQMLLFRQMREDEPLPV